MLAGGDVASTIIKVGNVIAIDAKGRVLLPLDEKAVAALVPTLVELALSVPDSAVVAPDVVADAVAPAVMSLLSSLQQAPLAVVRPRNTKNVRSWCFAIIPSPVMGFRCRPHHPASRRACRGAEELPAPTSLAASVCSDEG